MGSSDASSLPRPAGTAAARAGAALSALWFVGSVLFFIWVVQPLRWPVLSGFFLLYIVLLAVAINLRAGESPRDVGFRVDNFWHAARLAGPATLLLALLILAGGLLLGGQLRWRALGFGLLAYPLWGAVQQYALQGVVFRRVLRAGAGGWSSLIAAALFAAVHAPNPGLLAATFVAGVVWCEIYRRAPNLFVLGISHGILACLLLALLPWHITGGLRIGPDYLRLRAEQAGSAASPTPAPPPPPAHFAPRP